MLQELTIQNFAIISSLSVSFSEGMTVLTGETGAGKSIIIDAVGLLIGGRGSVDYIRQGASKCVLEGQFVVGENATLQALLAELDIELEDGVVIIHRDISKNGKNVCRVNGRLVNTGTLREIGNNLVDIHGQNEHQELMNSESHLPLLDQFGKESLIEVKNIFQKEYELYKKLRKKVQNKQKNEKEHAQRIDMLKFQCEEIERADLSEGEENRLLEERNKLMNFQKIAEALKNSYEAMQGDETSAVDRIGYAMNEMIEIENIDDEYMEMSEVIKNSYFQLQEVSTQLSRNIDTLEMDDTRLNEIEERLDVIRQLKRKYGESEAIILSYYKEIEKELLDSTHYEMKQEELEEQLVRQEEKTEKLAVKLSNARKKVARTLEKEIVLQLRELYMDKTEFEVRFLENEGKLGNQGLDRLEFYITTNPGEPLKPLVKVVSGGELSRIMLALKTIFSKAQGLTSIVFDEVDTGVSGRVAQAIANKIHQIAGNSQVLCITHLPQVAAVADTQYYIEKDVKDSRTETTLRKLTEEERVLEIARMLSGDEITILTKEHAQELLTMAKK